MNKIRTKDMKKTFYTAGKVWHNSKFQALRSKGYGVKARWIDLDNDSDFVLKQKDKLWNLCFEDVRDSDFVLFYAEDFNEEQRGALVEIGMAYGFQKPVYAVGKCKTVAPNEISDVAFTHFDNWHWLPTDDLETGAKMALEAEKEKETA
jgi:nucleoside 2-deoxyribosyltransferase